MKEMSEGHKQMLFKFEMHNCICSSPKNWGRGPYSEVVQSMTTHGQGEASFNPMAKVQKSVQYMS